MAANPYLGGNVVFNSSPLTNYYLGQIQQQHARDNAADQYYNNLTKGINTAGVRTQDIDGGLAKKISDWRTYAMQNRDALRDPRRDNYKTLTEFQQRYQDILNDTEQSKQAAQREMEAGKQYFDAQQKGTVSDEDLGIVHNMSRSIYDNGYYKQDGHTPYTPYDLTFLAQLPTQADLTAFTTTAAKGFKPTTTIVDGKIVKDPNSPFTGTRNFTEQTGFTNTDLQGIGNTARGLVSSPSFKRQFNEMYHDPATLEIFNPIFKQVTGKNIESPQDMAAAYVMQQHAAVQSVDKQEKWNDNYGQALALQNRRFAHEDAKERLKAQLKKSNGSQNAQVIEQYVTENFDNPSQEKPITVVKNGVGRTEYLVPNTPELIKVLSNGKLQPDAVHTYEKDGKKIYEGVFYKRGKEGNLVLNKDGRAQVDDKWTTKKSREGLKLSIGKELIGIKNEYGEATSAQPVENADASDDDYEQYKRN